jgi:hypothetical protein
MRNYMYNVCCCISCLINALLGGEFPMTLSERIRRHKGDIPLFFRVIMYIVCLFDKDHFDESKCWYGINKNLGLK